MKACQDRQEILLLDVYGELTPSERPAWEKHLELCEGCRQERDRLRRLLQRLKETVPSPALSPDKVDALAESIKRRLRREREKAWWQRPLWGFPNRLMPALAAVCLVMLVLGWFTLRESGEVSSFQSVSKLNSEEQMIVKDFEVIKNLELLEEMDLLQKLVRVVDEGTAHVGPPENGKI